MKLFLKKLFCLGGNDNDTYYYSEDGESTSSLEQKSFREHLNLRNTHQGLSLNRPLTSSLSSSCSTLNKTPLIEEDIDEVKENLWKVEQSEQKNHFDLAALREAKFHLQQQKAEMQRRLNSKEDRVHVGVARMLKDFQQQVAQVNTSAGKLQQEQQKLLALVKELTPKLEAFKQMEEREKARDRLRRNFLREKLQALERGPTNLDQDLMEAISKMDQKKAPAKKQPAKDKQAEGGPKTKGKGNAKGKGKGKGKGKAKDGKA